MIRLFLLVAALPFCDFLQNGLTAFGAPAIMGGIGASPEEYSVAATLYAAVAIAAIAVHRLLVEAIGWRRYLLASAACFAAGALACAASEGLPLFLAGRALTALGCGAFLTSGRVLVNLVPPSRRRFLGVRFFAAGLAWGAVAGPVLASVAIGEGDWRFGFEVLGAMAAALALLAANVPELPDAIGAAATPPRLRDLAGLALLVVGCSVLLRAGARASFDFFSDPGWLYAAGAFALPALALFVHNNASGSATLLAMRRVAQRRYLAGLAAFAIAYVIIGADNAALPYFMAGALDLPLHVMAADVGIGAVAGVATWIVLARLLPRRPGPWGYYAVAFGLLALCALQLARLSETADLQAALVPALACHGAFVVLVLATTAMQTFQSMQSQDDATFSLGNQLKNMAAQIALAFGSTGATLLLQWRGSLQYAVLSEHFGSWNVALQEALEPLARHLGVTHDAATAGRMALALLAQQAQREALLLAAQDYFRVLGWSAAGAAALAVVVALGACIQRTMDKRTAAA